MPLDPGWAAAAQGAGSILGDVANLFGQSKANKQSEQFQKDMYGQQRADALSDWNMQNAYNSPAAIMQRYRDAGLNPKLIYGNSGNASPAIRSSSPGSFTAQPLRVNSPGQIGSAFSTYYDLKLREAQTNNVAENTKVAVAEQANKAANTLATLSNIDRVKAITMGIDYDNIVKGATLDYQIEAKRLNNEQTEANINRTNAGTIATLDENDRRNAMQGPNLQSAAIRVLQGRLELARTDADISRLKAQIENIQKDSKIKDYEIDLNSKGMTKGDELYWRAIQKIVSGLNLQDAAKGLPMPDLGNWDPARRAFKNIGDTSKYKKR